MQNNFRPANPGEDNNETINQHDGSHHAQQNNHQNSHSPHNNHQEAWPQPAPQPVQTQATQYPQATQQMYQMPNSETQSRKGFSNNIFKSSKMPSVPYVAALFTFIGLIIVNLYSLLNLINYLVNNLISVKDEENTSSGLSIYFGSFEHTLALSAFAALLIGIPAMLFFARTVRNYESRDTWRLSQKWRRVIYSFGTVILISGVLFSLGGMAYDILTHSLQTNQIDYSSFDTSKKLSASQEIIKAIIVGLSGAILLGLGLFGLAGEYSGKKRVSKLPVLVVFSALALGLGIYTIVHIQGVVEKAKASNRADQSSFSDFQLNPGNSFSNPSGSKEVSQLDLDSIKSDLSYYKSVNKKYPTKAKWDDGSLKAGYLLSSDAIIEQVTYTPSGCDNSGCTSYALSAKDSSGKTITESSDGL